jgi:GT2 family glycosyltransferase
LEPPSGGHEVIVVDDASADPLDGAVAPFAGRLALTLIRAPKGGPAAARNLGAAHARGEYLAFTDDDCEPSENWLQALDRCFQQEPEGLVGGRTANAVTRNLYSEASQCLLDFLYGWQESKSGCGPRFFASNNLAVSRFRFESLGGFSPAYPFAAAEDRDFCARWIERGWELVYAPAAQVLHFHALSPFGFLLQHFTYGRGARTFHTARAARGAGSRVREPWRFYAGMIRHAMRKGAEFPHALILAMLILVSQLANAAGYFLEGCELGRRPFVD